MVKQTETYPILGIICLVFFLTSHFTWSQSLKTFNESCAGDCDESKGLMCSSTSQVCTCMNPNATVYDRVRKLCVTKAGHPCRRITGSSDTLCVSHASCSSLGLPCECKANFFQTRNGTCAPVAKYGESCSGKKPCDKSSGMECSAPSTSPKSFVCQCKFPKDQIYSKDLNKCISYAGGNCSFSFPCVPHASCSQDIFELKKGESLQGKTYMYNATVGRKCQCDGGFKGTKDRMCRPTFLSSCSKELPCNEEEGLRCHDNSVCLCGNPLQEEYNTKVSKCLSLVGSQCSGGTECVNNAACSSETSTCGCNEGFTSTPGRTCLKDFRNGCESSSGCNSFRGLHCDKETLTCSCVDGSLEYSEDTQRCVGKRGALCGHLLVDRKAGSVTALTQTSKEQSKLFEAVMYIECREGLRCSPGEFPTLSVCQ